MKHLQNSRSWTRAIDTGIMWFTAPRWYVWSLQLKHTGRTRSTAPRWLLVARGILTGVKLTVQQPWFDRSHQNWPICRERLRSCLAFQPSTKNSKVLVREKKYNDLPPLPWSFLQAASKLSEDPWSLFCGLSTRDAGLREKRGWKPWDKLPSVCWMGVLSLSVEADEM